MPTFSITIKGIDEMNRNLQRLVQRAPAGAGKTLYREALPIMADAQERCPVRFGVLRASGHVQLPVVEGARVSVTMGFGGAASAYAIPVHENLTAHHPVGEAKFLEKAVLAAIPGLTQKIAADFGQIFKADA